MGPSCLAATLNDTKTINSQVIPHRFADAKRLGCNRQHRPGQLGFLQPFYNHYFSIGGDSWRKKFSI
jgi:hypothetical protein